MKIDRRKFFKTVGTGTAALGLGSVSFVSQASSLSSQQKQAANPVSFRLNCIYFPLYDSFNIALFTVDPCRNIRIPLSEVT